MYVYVASYLATICAALIFSLAKPVLYFKSTVDPWLSYPLFIFKSVQTTKIIQVTESY